MKSLNFWNFKPYKWSGKKFYTIYFAASQGRGLNLIFID